MSRGFIFDAGKCVGCRACSAACSLRNKFSLKARTIHAWNNEAIPGIPVFYLSLACNHCEDPACMYGCPSGAYRKEGSAIIADPDKCIGCRYCLWNCPYDAPKYTEKGIVEKCHLCHEDLLAGDIPVCANACPTGALSYDELTSDTANPAWFPLTEMKPALELKGINEAPVTRVIPESIFGPSPEATPERTESREWSLVAFTFLAMILVSLVSSSMFTGRIPRLKLTLPLIILGGAVSLLHLGKPARSWRAIMNPATSPLSREIILYGIFSVLAVISSHFSSPILTAIATVAGMLLLVSIDLVYMMPDRKASIHSGQVLLGSLMLISYFSGNIIPFTFIALIKVFISARKIASKKLTDGNTVLRFLRVAVLLIAWAGLISGAATGGMVITGLILAGELTDRVIFYRDFNPENIRFNIAEHFKNTRYEKERS